MINTESIINKVWNFCTTLRDDGVSYGDCLEQITYLIFLKMVDEYSRPPYNRQINISKEFSWATLKTKRGSELEDHYIKLLRELANKKGMLGAIFSKSQNKIQDPAKLHKLIIMLDEISWVTLGSDIKGKIYEGLLEKNAEDIKSGAGQYFTPRALIRAIVETVRPEVKKTIADPACGTGGFFLSSYDFLIANNKMDKSEKLFLKNKTFFGNEIVSNTRRLALMNMFLHNIGSIDSESSISSKDALVSDDGERYDIVLANPPFGKKSSLSFTNDEGEDEKEDLTYNRQDFWSITSNKQLNFIQHIKTILKSDGRAAVVVPDNVLFEGGAGEAIRKKLLDTTEFHTILRLPTGIFYKPGVKANVIYFDSKISSKDPWTKEIWIYDYRTNIHHTLKKKPLKFENFKEFIKCFNASNRYNRKETWHEKNNPEGRWRRFSYNDVIKREKINLDIIWLKDKELIDFENLPDPDVLASDIIENIESNLISFKEILTNLNSASKNKKN